MRPITVRPIRFDDCAVGTTVFARKHKDFVMEYEVVSVRDSIGEPNHTHDYRSVHCRDKRFGSEWGFSFSNRKPGDSLDHLAPGSVEKMAETRPWQLSNTPTEWYVEVHCVGDTDGDGNCPLPACPKCGKSFKDEHLDLRVIEPEGVTVSMQVFVPMSQINLDDSDMAVARAKDIVENVIGMGVAEGAFTSGMGDLNGFEIDSISGRLVSENHVHIFDRDGILVAEDIRTTKMQGIIDNFNGHMFVDALEVDVKEAQRDIIRHVTQKRADEEAERNFYAGRQRPGRPRKQ